MGMETLCAGKQAPIYGHGDNLHWQKRAHIWTQGHFALAKRRPYMGMGAWGDVARAQRPRYMGMGTLCTGKKAPISGQGETLHWQNGHVSVISKYPLPPSLLFFF